MRPRTVAVITRHPQPQSILDAIMSGGDFDIVCVETMAKGYSCVKHMSPDLIVLCALTDDVDAYQVLSMLKLDDDTSHIPIVTYDTASHGVPAAQLH